MKKILKLILVFFASLMILNGILWLVVQIPQDAIKDNTYRSAKYLCEQDLFGKVITNVENTKVDRYADAILLGINYQMDGSIKQIMWSSYYHDGKCNEDDNLLVAVTEHKDGNYQYLRYWHGSIVVLRPLLIFFELKQIYILNAFIMIALIIILIIKLVKNKLYFETFSFIIGSVFTSIWVVPLSLEYTWTFIIMLISTITAVHLSVDGKKDKLLYLFVVIGVTTNFFDFLTTETLTLTIPLLLSFRILWRKNEIVSKVKYIVVNCFAWIIGYAFMWCMKWLIAAIILKENTLGYITEHVADRLSGNVGVGLIEKLLGSLWRNIACLFPMQYGMIGRIIVLVIVVILTYIAYVYKSDKVDYKIVGVMLFIGIIPYARFLILHSHSYLHCFFTYRAQLATIISILFAIDVIIGGRWPLLVRYKHSNALSE